VVTSHDSVYDYCSDHSEKSYKARVRSSHFDDSMQHWKGPSDLSYSQYAVQCVIHRPMRCIIDAARWKLASCKWVSSSAWIPGRPPAQCPCSDRPAAAVAAYIPPSSWLSASRRVDLPWDYRWSNITATVESSVRRPRASWTRDVNVDTYALAWALLY